MRLTVLLLLLCLPGPAVAAREVGVAPATRKVLPSTPTPAETRASLRAARNEWEAFQVVVRDSDGVAGVSLAVADLTGPGGAVVPAAGARLYREHYVEVTQESALGRPLHERAPGLYPDPLIPFEDPWSDPPAPVGAPFDLGPDETGTIFVDLYVPSGTVPGEYAGVATVSAADGWSVDLPIALTVWELDIPVQRTVATAFGFSANQVRKFHGGADGDPDIDAIVDRYYLALHEHRIDPTSVRGPVEFSFDDEGRLLPVDWTAYDAAVAPWLDGSRFPDGVGVTRFNVGRFSPGRGTGGLTEEQYKEAARAFAEHLEERGWWDRAYTYAIDEPWLRHPDRDFIAIDRDTDLLFAASELWRGKVLVTGPFDERIADKVGIWCPVTPMYDDWFWVTTPYAGWDGYSERLERGEELWFYVCNANFPPYAGYDLDTAIGYEPRIVKWGTWFERATGFLFWRANFWPEDDPWNVFADVAEFTSLFARNGDGFVLYPGDHDGSAGGKGSPADVALDGPVESYRLKQIRDGLEDWELFRLTSALGGEDWVRTQVRRAYQRFGDALGEDCDSPGLYCPDDQPWTLDETVLHDARRLVAEKALSLSFPDRYPDPEAVESDAGAVDAGPADAAPDPPRPEEPASDDGCACRLAGSSPGPLRWVVARRGGGARR